MRRLALSLTVALVVLFSLAASGIRARAQEATPALTPNTPGETVALNGADIYYEVYGEGDPVVLVHGCCGTGEDWGNQIPAFVDAGYQLIVIDSRGRGRSSHGPEPLSYELMAADVLGVMDHLNIDQAALVGWSDGAVIGLELGLHHPERLTKVVAYGANYIPEGFIPESAESDTATPAGDEATPIAEPATEEIDPVFAELMALWEVAPNFSEDQLKSISVPFLILDGEEEEVIRPDQPVRLAELIPGATLVLMPGVGHFAMFDQPEEFNRIVLEFLGSSAGEATATP
jgi:pimeloyl-ACP methyl ester carboxylesterase